jgi:hypothetical protein
VINPPDISRFILNSAKSAYPFLDFFIDLTPHPPLFVKSGRFKVRKNKTMVYT